MSQQDQPKLPVECRFATLCESRDGSDDLHVVKVVEHQPDGSLKPKLLQIKNYKRPFYITKKGKRDFKEFKEWADLEDLDNFYTTESNKTNAVATALKTPWFRGTLKDLCTSPYVFGVDITSTSIIKQEYKNRFPEVQTKYSNAVFDTETDVLHGSGEIIMASLTFNGKVLTVVKKSFLFGFVDVERSIKDSLARYLDQLEADAMAEEKEEDRKILTNSAKEARRLTKEVEIVLVDKEIDIVTTIMKRAHELKPDFLSVWNIEFDMNKVINACKRAGANIADIMSDPSIPPEFRFFRYKEGPAKKKMASGRILNFKNSQRWHSVFAPSSFYWIDAMQAYRQVRTGAAELPSYGLEYISNKHVKIGKLKHPEIDKYTGLKKHQVFQSQYQIDYVVYNIFDCVVMEILDMKTMDLQLSLPMFAGCTDFTDFKSLPRKSMNELHWYCLERGRVPGSTAKEMATDDDNETTGVNGWIVMLPSHLIADNGLCLIEENPTLRTSIRTNVADLDVAGAYPNNTIVFNVSKETTSKELIDVIGVDGKVMDEETVKMQTINFSAGHTNAVQFCQEMYQLPSMVDLLNSFKHDKGLVIENEPNPALVLEIA